MRRLPPLAAVRAFEAAARTENFTAAAAELGMTQAAISYQVKSLEERLGAPLFVRERGRARLTPLGLRLLPSLSGAFDAIESAFASHRLEDEQLLTVTTTHTFANTWLAGRLGGFQMDHPDLAVRMTTSNDIVDLRGGEADVAIRVGRGHWPGLAQHELFRSTFTLMASPACLAEAERKLGRAPTPADVPALHLVNPADQWWQQWFADNGIPADAAVLGRPAVRLDNQANEGHAAMAGQGFALLTPLLWRGDLKEGRLVAPFPERVSKRQSAYWLVYPEERRAVPKVKRFRDWLLAEIANLQPVSELGSGRRNRPADATARPTQPPGRRNRPAAATAKRFDRSASMTEEAEIMTEKATVYDEASEVHADGGKVVVDGPDGVDVHLTPKAAAETSDRLLQAAMKAQGNNHLKGLSHRPRS